MTTPLRMDTRRVLRTLEKPNNPPAQWDIVRSTAIDAWRCVHVEKLSDEDNQGNHCVYVDVIDKTGQRIAKPNVKLDYGWGGITLDTAFEKPAWEPGANFTMSAGMNAWCSIGNGDIVQGLRGEHGHTSYYVVFQLQKAGQVTPPVVTPPTQPGTINVPVNVILEVEQRLKQLQQAVDKLR